MDVFAGLLHDAPDGSRAPDVAAHRALLDRADGGAVGPLVVSDERLSGIADGIGVSVLTSTGAGGVAALTRRTGAFRLVAAESVLRDLDDLAGNAARVVAAAAELPDGIDVYVGLPAAPGLVEAVEVVEAAGLLGRVDLSAGAALLSVLVEADLPFKATGLGVDAFGPNGLVSLLLAVEALIDGADPDEADALLAGVAAGRARSALHGWDDATRARVRRRLLGADTTDTAATLDQLSEAGLLAR